MNRLYVPSLGPTDWRRLLADPHRHWKPRRSALELAVSWEAARNTERGLPPSVCDALEAVAELRGATLVIGLPEHVVDLEGGGHGSQNDLWALLRVDTRFVSMTVEAKAGEKLDDTVAEWLETTKTSEKSRRKSNKPIRLAAIQRILAIEGVKIDSIRYQLLHRAASALLEAERFCARYAVMLVQSFGGEADEQSRADFANFATLMIAEPAMGCAAKVERPTQVPLHIGWVPTPWATIETLSAAV